MKIKIKKILRKILKVRSTETVSDSLNRYKMNFLKKINKKSFTLEDLKKALISLDIKKGDILFVHSSWRSFIGFSITPQDFIDLLFDLVGKEGTILMPAYGYKDDIFDISKTISHAGIISEIFRNNKNVIRSNNPHFSVCAKGKDAKKLIEKHSESEYAFDKNSPYYLGLENNAKILLVGLGEKPHKHTIFHCATYSLKDEIDFYKKIFNYRRIVQMKENSKIIDREIIDRIPECRNDFKKMKKAFQNLSLEKTKKAKIGYLDLIIYDSNEAYNTVRKMGKNGDYIYRVKVKSHNRLKMGNENNV